MCVEHGLPFDLDYYRELIENGRITERIELYKLLFYMNINTIHLLEYLKILCKLPGIQRTTTLVNLAVFMFNSVFRQMETIPCKLVYYGILINNISSHSFVSTQIKLCVILANLYRVDVPLSSGRVTNYRSKVVTGKHNFGFQDFRNPHIGHD